MLSILAAVALLKPLLTLLVIVLVAVVIHYVVGLFVPDGKFMQVLGYILGLVILVYGLRLFGLVA